MKSVRKIGINGSTLKIIAIITMLMDHIALFVLDRLLIHRGLYDVVDQISADIFMAKNGTLFFVQDILRMFGRISFPIFCFLLVQGFLHTKNIKKYLSRLFLFALISEIPFDLALSGTFFYFEYQNIYFTLFLGIIALVGIRFAEEKKQWNMVWRILFALLSVSLCSGFALLLKTDYDVSGILIISIFYVIRQKKLLASTISCFILKEVPAFLSILPISLYNGQRGSNVKWLFYVFYPLHLLLLFLLVCAMGMGHISLV